MSIIRYAVHHQRGALHCLAICVLMAFSATSRAAENCDRACLTGLITQYVDALVVKDPARLQLPANIKFTEDSRRSSRVMAFGKPSPERIHSGRTIWTSAGRSPHPT